MTYRSCTPRKALVFFALTLPLWAGTTIAQAPSLAASMPSDAIVYVEFSDLGSVIERIRTSEPLKLILGTPHYDEIRKTEPYRKADAVRRIVEAQLGMDLWTAGKRLLIGQMAVALYPKPDDSQPDFVAIIRVHDQEAFARLRERIDPVLVLLEDQIERIHLDNDTERIEAGDKAFFAINRSRVVATNNRDLLDDALSLRSGKGGSSLAESEVFRRMGLQMGTEHFGRAFLNTHTIAEATGGRYGFPEKLDNPVVSLLLGGIMELVVRSPFAGFTLDVEDQRFVLTAGVSGGKQDLGESYAPYFSSFPGSGTPPIPQVADLIGGITVFRDFAGWYGNREDLLDPKVLPGFDKFESGLANLLPGRDFEEDVMSRIGDNLSLIAAHQDFSHLDGTPGVKLPGFAAIIDLAQPKEGAEMFQLFFQTLAAILNIEAGQQGRQPWLLNTEVHNGVEITSGRYLKKPTGDRLPLVFNFMPASARVENRFIISSSLDLCRALIDELKKPDNDEPADKNFNTELYLKPLSEILEANREYFESQRIQEGRTADEARRDVGIVFDLLRHFRAVDLSTSVSDASARLQLKGSWR